MPLIRKLTRADSAQYKALRLLSLQTDPDVYFTLFSQAKHWGDDRFSHEINGGSLGIYGYYGYFLLDRLLGYISLSRPYFEVQQHVADIFNLYVLSDFRRQKIATSLLQYLINQIKREKQIETLFLSVMAQNHQALTLYQNLGFSEYALKKRSIKRDNRYFDEVLMRLDL